jgi:hypothetical protein
LFNPAQQEGNNGELTATKRSEDFSLLELIDRILDKGLVINGDITLSIAGTDFLSLKINLVIASLETAKRYGIELPWEKWENEKVPPENEVSGPSGLGNSTALAEREYGGSRFFSPEEPQMYKPNPFQQKRLLPNRTARRTRGRSGQGT